MSLAKRATAEALGTALLHPTVVGSGIMAQQLSGGNTAVALLANTLATGAIATTPLFRWIVPGLRAQAKEVVISHNSETGKN